MANDARAAMNGIREGGNVFQTPIDPSVPGRPDPEWSIDTRTFNPSTAVETPNGGLRNNIQFWKQWAKLRPETLSAENLQTIDDGFSPIVDETWIESFPEHEGFEFDTLVHHHVNQGPFAIPVPESSHVGFGGVWH